MSEYATHATPADAAEQVAEMPRRTAHALFALLEAGREHGGPVTAAEIVLYDAEAPNAQSTAQALRAGARRGLCFRVPAGNGVGACWWATNDLYLLRSALEERYLRETDTDDPNRDW